LVHIIASPHLVGEDGERNPFVQVISSSVYATLLLFSPSHNISTFVYHIQYDM
jgi:hypothetical protein